MPERLIPCPKDNEECRYYPACFRDIHHTYPQRLGRVAMKGRPLEERRTIKAFINHPAHLVETCRNIHDLLDVLPAPALPSLERMERFVGRDE